jgi:hypothetical protein
MGNENAGKNMGKGNAPHECSESEKVPRVIIPY